MRKKTVTLSDVTLKTAAFGGQFPVLDSRGT